MTVCLLDSDSLIDDLNGFHSTIAVIELLYRQGHDLATCDVVTW